MNTRIKELLKQATTDINPEDREWVFSRVDQAKFAELIVKECCSAIRLDDAFNGGKFQRTILKHFGIEE
jgi:hypothetical protein